MWKFAPPALQQRFDRNMAFFKESMPAFHKRLLQIELKNVTLSVNGTTEKIDVFNKSQSLYLGDAERQVEAELSEFLNKFQSGAPITTIIPIAPNNYSGPRYFHKHLNTTINRMNHEAIHPRDHLLPDTMPMVFFSGVGCGLQIQRFVERKECQILVVQESNPELFLVSLYLTDWYDFIPQFRKANRKNFNIILTDSDNDEDIFKANWNELIRYTPLFPSLTVFYNHRRQASHDRAISRMQAEFKVFMTAWGFYDDEVNQFNNARHNLHNLVPILHRRLSPALSIANIQMNAVVVGAGPSLNERIDWIIEHRDKIVLFSAGTALSVLKHHGIVPDVHVEIESDYATVLHLEHTLSDDYQVPLLVGAIQLNPRVFQMVKHRLMFFKDSTALFELFGKSNSAQLQGMTPTCTNAATGLAIQLGFQNVFLFGTDFGYKDPKSSHATGSVYFDQSAPSYLRQVGQTRAGKMTVPSIDGEPLTTEPIYNSARDRIEKLLELHQKRCSVYNCATGADIKYTHVIRSAEEFESCLGERPVHPGFAQRLLYESTLVPDAELTRGSELLLDFLRDVSEFSIARLNDMEPSRAGLVHTVLQLAFWREDYYRKTRSSLYFFTRGTLWHYINAGVSAAFSTTDEAEIQKHIELWRDGFIDFLVNMPKHFDWVRQRKDSIEEDTWLDKRITESVEDPFVEEESQ